MKWLILGHFGGHNTGDDAMLAGLIDFLNCLPQIQITIVAKNLEALPPIVGQSPNIRVISMAPCAIFSEVVSCDGVIVGGGTHFHDDYNKIRLLRHYRYLLRYILIFLIFRLRNKPVLSLSVGYGPISRLMTRALAKLGSSLCNHITVRDQSSYKDVCTLLPKSKVTLAFDLASLIARNNESSGSTTLVKNRTRTLGISVLSMQNILQDDGSFDRLYWEIFVDTLIPLLEQYQWQVKIFIIRGGPRESDVALSSLLYKKILQRIGDQRISLIPYNTDPTLTLNEIKTCEAFIATRYHAAMLAYLAGCRLLLIPYHRKVRDLADEIGLSPDACLPCNIHEFKQSLEEKIRRLLQDSSAYYPTLSVSDAQKRTIEGLQVIKQYMRS